MPKDSSGGHDLPRHISSGRLQPYSGANLPTVFQSRSNPSIHRRGSSGQLQGAASRSSPSLPRSLPVAHTEGATATAGNEPSPALRSRLGERRMGGRGREWVAECLKLLEALLELDDSKPFREPVDPLKYPEYYSIIGNPIDLSKVMLNFHGGIYRTVEEFAEDMRQMFENYKTYFKDPDSQIYTQVHRLAWWFEAEVLRIKEQWDKACLNRMTARNMRRHGYKQLLDKLHSSDPSLNLSTYGNNTSTSDAGPPPAGPMMSASTQDQNTNIILSIKHGMCTIVPGKPGESEVPAGEHRHERTVSAPAGSAFHARRHGAEMDVARSSGHYEALPTDRPRAPPRILLDRQPSKRKEFRAESRKSTAGNPNSHELAGVNARPNRPPEEHTLAPVETSPPVIPPPPAPTTQPAPRTAPGAQLELKLAVSNVWYGSARNKPPGPVTLNDRGFFTTIKQSDKVTDFQIHAEEILRCCAHFGRSRKHTLFVFVTPTCSRRLEALGEKFSSCSLVVIFLSALPIDQISRMIHIFYTISQNSVFGQLFSEVDQRAALSLLANIKPAILTKVTDKFKDLVMPPEMSVTRDGNRRLLPVTSTRDRDTTNSSSDVATAGLSSSANTTEASGASELPSLQASGPSSENLPGLPSPEANFTMTLQESIRNMFQDRRLREMLRKYASQSSHRGDSSRDGSANPDSDAPLDMSCRRQTPMDIEEESDIEIVMPSDSENEDSPDKVRAEVNEEGLVMTREKVSIKCPILQQVMQYPVKNKHCGHCYDRQGVQELIRNRGDKARCPCPGCSNPLPLNMTDMLYEYELWKRIQTKTNPEFAKSPKQDEAD